MASEVSIITLKALATFTHNSRFLFYTRRHVAVLIICATTCKNARLIDTDKMMCVYRGEYKYIVVKIH